jgi:hypothetical protein
MRMTAAFFLFFVPALFSGATAQSTLPPETPEAIRRDMETIEKYRAEVERLSGSSGKAPEKPGEAKPAAEPLFPPLVVAPPPTSITPDPTRRAGTERDPFEVSPRLRESGGRNRSAPDGMALSQALRLRAVVRGVDGGIAKIQSGQDTIIVRDGDELDVNGIRYTVKVEADGLVLRGSGAPQYKMLVR